MEKAFTQVPSDLYINIKEIVREEGRFARAPLKSSATIRPLRPHERPSLSLRFLAFILDQGILFVPQTLFSIAIAGMLFFTLINSKIELSFVRAMCVGSFFSSMILVNWLYFSLSESSSKKATFGMTILGLKVQKEHGQRIDFFEASNRYWAWFFSSLFFGLNLLGLLSKKKELYHNQLSHTEVVIES